MNFLLQNLFLITSEHARRTFDSTDWNGRKVQDMILTKGVPETPMEKEDVRNFINDLLK